MDTMLKIAQAAMGDMPPQSRFDAGDAAVILDHRDLLLSLEDRVVKRFYDTLYAHPATASVFVEGERPAREGTLVHWWRRTVNGPLDDQYFAWMAMVGMVHVARNVSNPMMLAMADHTVTFVAEQVEASGMEPLRGARLVLAFRRLAATVGAIITDGYDHAVTSALFTVAGMPEALLHRLRDQEIADALREAHQEIGLT